MKRSSALYGALGVAILATSLSLVPAQAAGFGYSARDQEVLASYARAVDLARQRASHLWPGFRLDRAPFVFFDQGRATFLVNFPRAPQGFVPFRANLPIHPQVPVYVHWGPLPALDHVHDLTIHLAGTYATLLPYAFLFDNGQIKPEQFWPPAFMSYNQRHDALYPMYQDKNESWENAYPTGDAENRAYSEVEDRLLALALRAPSRQAAFRYVHEFLAVRHTRYQHLDPEMARFEHIAEGFDGSMDYTEHQFAQDAGASLRQTEGVLMSPLDVTALRHDRYPTSGYAQILLLDRFSYPWKAAIIDGTDTLEGMLAKATHYPAAEQPTLLADAEAETNFDALLAQAKQDASQFPGTVADFMKSPGIRITMDLAPVQDDNSTADPERAGKRQWFRLQSSAAPLQVDGQTMLVDRVDDFNYRKDATWLELSNAAMMMRSDEQDWPFQQVTFFADRPDFVLDGRPFALHRGSYPFRTLSVRTDRLELRAAAGTLVVEGNTVTVRHD